MNVLTLNMFCQCC